jgi:O-antigen ligase
MMTRAVSEWLTLFGFHLGGISLEEGSPLDASVYYSLIAAGLYVLHKRHVRFSEVFRDNKWLFIFLIWGFISIVWSDFPFSAFKRWTKVIGHPIMVLVLFTEPDPIEAVTRLMKRCAYIVVPISVLFIKYYPEWGRGFSEWTGQGFNTGIAGGKNALGYDCLILGFFLFWYFLQTWAAEQSRPRRNELLLVGGLLAGIWWLFSNAQSSTCLVSFLLATLMVVILGRRCVSKEFIGTYLVSAIVLFAIAEMTFGISKYLVSAVGRDTTLTGRTEIWKQVLAFHTNPLIGVGFESFWLGDRYKTMGDLYWWQANEAHNGYLETYLTLGVIGVLILIGVILATFFKTRRELWRNFEWGRFRLGFLLAVIVYNWTESAFRALHPVWFVFYIIALDYRGSQFVSAQWSPDLSETEEEFAYGTGGAAGAQPFSYELESPPFMPQSEDQTEQDLPRLV